MILDTEWPRVVSASTCTDNQGTSSVGGGLGEVPDRASVLSGTVSSQVGVEDVDVRFRARTCLSGGSI